MTITDGAVKQIQPMALPGKVLVTWGDQIIIPSRKDLEFLYKRSQ